MKLFCNFVCFNTGLHQTKLAFKKSKCPQFSKNFIKNILWKSIFRAYISNYLIVNYL
jgi:hypothetical protein